MTTIKNEIAYPLSMETWWFLVLEFAVAIILISMSGRQPFPGPSKRYGVVLLIAASLFLIGETSPRETEVQVHLFFLLVFGSVGLIRGVKNMLVTREEVIVAPFAGILFSISATAMMAEQWDTLTQFEEYAAFATIGTPFEIQAGSGGDAEVVTAAVAEIVSGAKIGFNTTAIASGEYFWAQIAGVLAAAAGTVECG